MRVLIISDIHSNLCALKAVVEDVGWFDRVVCLGDIVGYGPDPEECVQLLKSFPDVICILGNHDAAVLDVISTGYFNPEAGKALKQQKQFMSEDSLHYLASLPEMLVYGDLCLSHGSPRDPLWEYIDQGRVAWEVFEHFDTDGCLVGHTHMPCIFFETEDFKVSLLKPKSRDRWIPKNRFILNPGAVGQPRDGNPHASYVIWDTIENSFLFKRVGYDIQAVVKRIKDRGIPLLQGKRLNLGR